MSARRSAGLDQWLLRGRHRSGRSSGQQEKSYEDQSETDTGANGQRLAQQRYAKRQRNRGVDVCDDGGPYRADLGDECKEQKESDGDINLFC